MRGRHRDHEHQDSAVTMSAVHNPPRETDRVADLVCFCVIGRERDCSGRVHQRASGHKLLLVPTASASGRTLLAWNGGPTACLDPG